MKANLRAALAVLLTVSAVGCFTPKYQKIPLEKNEIPYVLADGDYTDKDGNIHKDQHNMWAMSEADVYGYIKSLTRQEKKTSFLDRIKGITKEDVKSALLWVFGTLTAVLLLVLKIKSRKKHHAESDSDYDEED